MTAAYKARRFAAFLDANDPVGRPDPANASGRRVVDLCCGVGGDAMALTAAGLPVLAVDADPMRAWMTGRNAGCDAATAPVESLDLRGAAAFHFDPDRRSVGAKRGGPAGGGRRAWRFADYQPGPAFLRQVLAACPHGAVKLGPGVDLEEVEQLVDDVAPSPGAIAHEMELISKQGRLVQAVLWSGALAGGGGRRATRLSADGADTLTGDAASPHQAPLLPWDVGDEAAPAAWLFAIDAAVERADLLPTLCTQTGLPLVHPQWGLLAGPDRRDSPWLTPFRWLAVLPWRPRAVQAWLRQRGAGLVEVKTRGKACDPDAVQQQLRGPGRQPFTVFVLRRDKRLLALIAQRPDA